MDAEFIPQMVDCIEREALTNALDELCDRVCIYSKKQRSAMCGACPLGDAFDVVEALPAADVRTVMRGKWIIEAHRTYYDTRCSVCGIKAFVSIEPNDTVSFCNFCPNCGAKMEG